MYFQITYNEIFLMVTHHKFYFLLDTLIDDINESFLSQNQINNNIVIPK